MKRIIWAIIAILATVGLLMLLTWMHVAPEIWVGVGTLGVLAVGIYEFRQQRSPMLRRRNLLVLGGAYAFLIVAYVLSTVRPS